VRLYSRKRAKENGGPEHVQTFNFFGSALREMNGQWEGDCIFCGKERHFYTDQKEGLWDCKVCGRSGNRITFLEQLFKAAQEEATDADWEKLSTSRRIPVEILKTRRLAFAGERWLIPGCGENGRFRDLRVYNFKQIISAAGCKSCLYGVEKLSKSKPGSRVWVCEGEWDALALEWLLEVAGITDQTVTAVPGASVLKDEWVHLFNGREVVCAYDNDEAGDRGAEKADDRLRKVAKRISFVNWPRSSKTGYDLRDFICDSMEAGHEPEKILETLLKLQQPKPRAVQESDPGEKPADAPEVGDFSALVKIFGEHIKMSRDMTDCLCLMVATAISNDIQGDPIWLYLVGPPGTGKTLLLASLATSSRCLMRSTVTPHSLVSGWRGDADKDPSLIPKLAGLTLVAKDFTEILTMPPMMQDEIFSTLRGAYDGFVSKSFGNGAVREYKNCRFSLLAGVTHAIHACKTASLGERFLKFQFKIPAKEHAEAAVRASIASVGTENAIESALSACVESFLARKVTKLPPLPGKYINKLTALVQLIALLRAQVARDPRSGEVMYRPGPEAGTRLAKQLAKLSRMVAFVLDRDAVDDACYTLTERVAFDTAYGFHLDLVDAIMRAGGKATMPSMRQSIGVSHTSVNHYCEDLCMLGVLEDSGQRTEITSQAGRPAVIYQVTQKLATLWRLARGEMSWTPRLKLSKPFRSKLVLRRT
jgi:hypothetical protein